MTRADALNAREDWLKAFDSKPSLRLSLEDYASILERMAALLPVSVPVREPEKAAFLADWQSEAIAETVSEADAIRAAEMTIECFIAGAFEPTVSEETLP